MELIFSIYFSAKDNYLTTLNTACKIELDDLA